MATTFNVEDIRKQFPILNREVYGKPLVYFDNGATTQKPQVVIDRITEYYANENANIHRGVHFLSQEGTAFYEDSRKTVQQFINAKHLHEVIFTKGTTDAINLVASSFRKLVNKGDEIIVSEMEHHSNIVPWQMLCEEKEATLKVIPAFDNGELDMDTYQNLLSNKTKLVAVTHISNTLGTVNPVEQIIEKAHAVGAKVLIDGAQSIAHKKIDVQALNCDFFAFSGHKMYGPTGIGVLYGKEDILNAMPPYQGGGDMIDQVSFAKTTYNELPHKFEAGTPNIVGGIALGTAVDFITNIGLDVIAKHEDELLAYATQKVSEIEDVKLIGTAAKKAGVLSFLIGEIHPYDLGTILDRLGIAIRTGHHCTQPLMDRYGIPGTDRASFAIYNTKAEIDVMITALIKAKGMLS
jgi:cysteine desulfurase/selenocysteine lyase